MSNVYMWNPSMCDYNICNIEKYLDIRCPLPVFVKLVIISCEHEISNTSEISLLVVFFISYYYYCTRQWIKKEYSLSH